MNRRSLLKYITAGVATSAPLAAIQLPRFANRKRVYGRFDYRAAPILMDPPELWQARCGIVLLNGAEIRSCWYANTVTGIVKTYDVLHDGSVATTTVKRCADFPDAGYGNDPKAVVVDITNQSTAVWRHKIATLIAPGPVPVEWWTPEDFPDRDVSCPIDGVLCETLHGEVEIWGPEL